MNEIQGFSTSDKATLGISGVTATLTSLPFLVFFIIVLQYFITFILTPADATLIFITAGLAYSVTFILYVGALCACVAGFAIFVTCGILILVNLRKNAPRSVPVSMTVVFVFDIIVITIAAIPLFVCLRDLIWYGDERALPDLAYAGVPFLLALANLIVNRIFTTKIKRPKI